MTSKSSVLKKENTNQEYAIVETSGTQFWLEANRYYDLDRIKAEVNEKITLEKVLLFSDGKDTTLGKPYIKGASVDLRVMAHRRGAKILVYKMRPKKKTRRKNGHRQELTRVMVESISLDSTPKKVTKASEKQTKTPTKTPRKKSVKASEEKKEVK